MKTVYIIYHTVAYEGSSVVGVYSTHSKAKEESIRLGKDYYSKRLNEWNSKSKQGKLICGSKSDYLTQESWSVEEYNVKE